jgi:hypothetical protein
MNASYREMLILLCILCQLVPSAMAFSPATMTRSKIARLTVHVGAVGLWVAAAIYLPLGPLRYSVFAVALMALFQYWAFVLLEGAFERRYHRAPQVSSLMRRFDTKFEDKLMSLACWGLGFVAACVVVVVGPRLS